MSYAGTLLGFDAENSELRTGIKPEYGLDDGGQHTDSTFWFFEGADTNDNHSVIRSYADVGDSREDRYDGYDPVENPLPSWHHEAMNNDGLLDVDVPVGSALLRTFNPVVNAQGTSAGQAMTKDGLYFDAQVRIAAFDAADVPSAESFTNNKISVWCKTLSGPDECQVMITAGSVEADGTVVPVHYATTSTVRDCEWHRLTIRAIKNVATRGQREYAGFTVYLDGRQVSCSEGDYSIGSGAGRFEGNYDYDSRALFPSMQGVGHPKASALHAVACGGVVQIDEAMLVDEKPFTHPADKIETAIVCDDAALSELLLEITHEGEVFTNAYNGAISGLVITNYPGDVVKLIPVLAPNYTPGSVKLNGNRSAASLSSYTIRYADEFKDDARLVATLTTYISAFRFMGEEYPTFGEIVELALGGYGNGSTVELVQDVSLDADASVENGQLWVKPQVELKLDLRGHAIKGNNYREEAAVYAQGRFTIFDSVGGGSISAPGPVIEVALANDAVEVNHEYAEMQLGDEGTELFFVTGVVRCTEGRLTVMGGQYTNPGGVAADEFYLAEYVLDDGRFSWEAVDDRRAFRVQNLGNVHTVDFSVEHGAVVPTNRLLVADGGSVNEAGGVAVDAPGYTNVWYNGAELFDLDTPVKSNLTLVAAQYPVTSTIRYFNRGVEEHRVPSSYSVETAKASLPAAYMTRKVFGGWKDRATGHIVDFVGSGAVFADATNIVVTGDLELDAVWSMEQYSWSNAAEGLVESNGVYGGVFDLKVPAGGTLITGINVRIKEIDFCVVNPVTYPKTAPYLAVVTNQSAKAVVSARWDSAAYLGAGDEYQMNDARRLANGRPKVSYVFDDLVLKVGTTYEIYFAADEEGTRASGFLRLVPSNRYVSGVIGNCYPDSPGAPSEEYGGYRPVYEVKGEACDE